MDSADIRGVVLKAFADEHRVAPGAQLVDRIVEMLEKPPIRGGWYDNDPDFELAHALVRFNERKHPRPVRGAHIHDIHSLCEWVLFDHEEQPRDDPEWQPILENIIKIKEAFERATTPMREIQGIIDALRFWTQPFITRPGRPANHLRRGLVDLLRGNKRPQEWMYRVAVRLALPREYPHRKEPFSPDDIKRAAASLKEAYKPSRQRSRKKP